MTDREIIRAEIERRMKCFKNERNTITKASDNNLSLGTRIAMCEELLSFIDSLQEEPQVKESAKVQHINETCKESVNSLTQEPVSDDLEEEIDNYVKRNGYDGLDSIEEVKYIANHFTEWQKEQMMGMTKIAKMETK